MYCAVPSTELVCVIVELPARAMPKSITLMVPSGVSTMLWGLMSRWITSYPCATESAAHTCCAYSAAFTGSNGPRCCTSVLRSVPATYSMTM